MNEANTYLYEGLFLFNQQEIGSSIAKANEIMQDVLNRAEAEAIAVYKWDDRRLAFEIKGQKRGLYMLAYFRARGSQIANIERDVNLSEQMLRCLILRAEHIGDVELEEARKRQEETLTAAALQVEEADAASEDDAGFEPPAEGASEAPAAAAPAATETATEKATETATEAAPESPEPAEKPAPETTA